MADTWISAAEKKPPCGERVLVCLGGQCWEARYTGGGRWHRYNGYDIEWWMNERVTAWMPMPLPQNAALTQDAPMWK